MQNSRLTVAADNRSKPKLPIKDKEVAKADHDDLLLWLIDHLTTVVRILFVPDAGKILQHSRAACAAYESDLDAAVRSCLANAERPGVSADLASALRDKSKQIQALQGQALPAFDQAMISVRVGEWESQYEVATREPRRKVVGYVDCVAKIQIPTDVALAPLHNQRAASLWSGLAWRRSDVDKVQHVRAFPVDAPHWQLAFADKTVWFDARLEIETIGSLLQELKYLRHNHLPANGHICMVCNSLAPKFRRILEHEGFFVIERHAAEHLKPD